MIDELATVVLARDLPTLGLESGDVGTVVHVYADRLAVEVEFTSGRGKTVGVETLPIADVRELAPDEILHVRAIAA